VLVQPDYVSSRIGEPSGNFGRVRADWLHDFAAVSNNEVKDRGHIIDHDIEE
jgi:hypothetical protein